MSEKLQPSSVFALPQPPINSGTDRAPETPESRYRIGKLVTVEIKPGAISDPTRAPFDALIEGSHVTVTTLELGDEYLLYLINGILHGAQSPDGGIGYSIEATQSTQNPARTKHSLIAIEGSENANPGNLDQILEVIRNFNARDRRDDMRQTEIFTTENRTRLAALRAVDPEAQDIRYEDIRVPTALQIAAILGVWAAAAGIAYVSMSSRTPKSPDTHLISAPAKPDQQQPGAQQLAPATAPIEK